MFENYLIKLKSINYHQLLKFSHVLGNHLSNKVNVVNFSKNHEILLKKNRRTCQFKSAFMGEKGRRSLITVLRSPFVFKKSRAQFQKLIFNTTFFLNNYCDLTLIRGSPLNKNQLLFKNLNYQVNPFGKESLSYDFFHKHHFICLLQNCNLHHSNKNFINDKKYNRKNLMFFNYDFFFTQLQNQQQSQNFLLPWLQNSYIHTHNRFSNFQNLHMIYMQSLTFQFWQQYLNLPVISDFSTNYTIFSNFQNRMTLPSSRRVQLIRYSATKKERIKNLLLTHSSLKIKSCDLFKLLKILPNGIQLKIEKSLNSQHSF